MWGGTRAVVRFVRNPAVPCTDADLGVRYGFYTTAAMDPLADCGVCDAALGCPDILRALPTS
jgi:hypothetical protein